MKEKKEITCSNRVNNHHSFDKEQFFDLCGQKSGLGLLFILLLKSLFHIFAN